MRALALCAVLALAGCCSHTETVESLEHTALILEAEAEDPASTEDDLRAMLRLAAEQSRLTAEELR